MADGRFLLVSINPDWVDEMGHHAQFDRTLRDRVIARDGTFISLVATSLVPS